MIYSAFGIPLTFLFITHLSFLVKRAIHGVSLLLSYLYSSHYLRCIRQGPFVRFDQEEVNQRSSGISSPNRRIQSDESDLTLTQIVVALLAYVLLSAYFLPSESVFDSFYLCFTSLFTISFNQENDLSASFFTSTYLPDRTGHGSAIRHSHPSADTEIIGGRGKETTSKSL